MTEYTYEQVKGIIDLQALRTTPEDRKAQRIGQVAMAAFEPVAVKGRTAPVTVYVITNRKVEDATSPQKETESRGLLIP